MCTVASPGLADYSVISVLGEGVRGVTYRTFAPDTVATVGSSVAVTVFRELRNADQLAACRADLETIRSLALGRINHIHSISEAGGRLVQVSDYAPLGSLARPARPLPREHVLRALRDAALGLASLHAAGVVHGGVSPANVLVVERGGLLADPRPRSLEQSGTLLAPGPFDASLYAVAPEVLRGQPPAASSDVWSLGAAIHRALTGEHVYRMAGSLDAIEALDAALSASAMMSGPLRPAEATIIARCIADDPTDRPTSIDEIVGVLDALAGRTP
jgi:serine/threonine protein kinase